MSSTSLSGNYQARSKAKTSSETVNPHHLVVEQRAISLSKDSIALLQETLSSSKYREILRHSQKSFVDSDKVFARSENRTEKIQKLLRAVEKQEERICTSLSSVPTIQANIAAAQSHFK